MKLKRALFFSIPLVLTTCAFDFPGIGDIGDISLPDIPIFSGSSLTSGISLSEGFGNTDNTTLELDPIGPCEEYGNNITLTGTVYNKLGLKNVREKLSVTTSDGLYSYFATTAAHNVGVKRKAPFILSLPISSLLGKEGIDCKVSVIDSKSEEICSHSFSLKPSSYSKINVKDYLTSYRINNDVVVNPDRYATCHQEEYIFDSFVDFFNEDNYYRLNLRKISLTYSCFQSFPGCTAKLRFTDYNKVFPYLDNDDQIPSFEIPLRYIAENSKVCFDFPELMYVNPKTLEMSLNARPDFKLTRYFYLPINKKELLIDQTFALEVSDFGYDKTSFSWNLTYLNNRNLLGDCNNSDYCVVGEMD